MPIPNAKMQAVCLQIANGHHAAANSLLLIADLVRRADNIVDGHSADPQADMAAILRAAFVDLPRNPFYSANADLLSGPWLTAIMGWQLGDEWKEADNRKTRMFGFVYREAIEHVAHNIAYLAGGADHAMGAAKLLHQISHEGSPETFEDWEAE